MLPAGLSWGSGSILTLGKLVAPAAWKGGLARRAPLAASHTVGCELHEQSLLLQNQEPRVALERCGHRLASPHPRGPLSRGLPLCQVVFLGSQLRLMVSRSVCMLLWKKRPFE